VVGGDEDDFSKSYISNGIVSRNVDQMWYIWGFLGGYYEECLLGCDAVWLLLRTSIFEEEHVSIFRVKIISELGTR
jgi:hypothetical protein